MAGRKIAVTVGGTRNQVLFENLNGIWMRARENGDDVYAFLCYGGRNEDETYNKGEYNIFSLIQPEDYDGFIMVSRNIDSEQERKNLADMIVKSGKLSVSLENDIPGMLFAGIDNYQTFYHLTEHLIREHGCKKIYYISGPAFDYENTERYRGFRSACRSAGILSENDCIGNFQWSYESGFKAYRKAKTEGILEKADAFLCANDNIALGFMTEAKKDGYSVPRDFIVTGFDNDPAAGVFAPRLTTIERERVSAGYRSCDLLLQALSGNIPPRRTRLDSSCVFSESCGCVSGRDTKKNRAARSKMVDHDLRLEGNRFALNRMEKILVNSADMQELFKRISGYAGMLESHAFFLMLNETCFGKLQNPDSEYRMEEYDEKVRICVSLENGQPRPDEGKTMLRRRVVPEIEGNGHLYLISPIHFQGHCLGYCVSADSLALIECDSYFDWINNIDLSVLIFYERQMLGVLNERLNLLCMEDPMTGLYNRFGYSKKADELFRRNSKTGNLTLVMFMDMNGLKEINDTYGHEHGDLALRTLAQAVKLVTPEGFIPVRYGGDEFIIVGKCNDAETAETLKDSICGYLEAYNKTSVNPYDVTVSIGYTLAEPGTGTKLDFYVRQADSIMYCAKKKYKAEKAARMNHAGKEQTAAETRERKQSAEEEEDNPTAGHNEGKPAAEKNERKPAAEKYEGKQQDGKAADP